MTDPKKTDEDIVATEAETLSDDKLEDVDGGWSWGVSQSLKTSMTNVNLSVDAETITAASSFDKIEMGGLENTVSGGMEKVGVLRKRPTR